MLQQKKWMILGGVILAILLSSLDQTIVATAMPTIVKELHGMEHFSWVFTAYMLGSTVTVPIYGKLSDMFGRRKLYLLAIVIFLTGSILCGMAGSMNALILFRAIQGIGGGAMMVNSFAVIGDVFPPAERSRYQGLIGGVFGISSIAGPLLGGWITDHVSWRWVFYVNIPLGLVAMGVLAATLPRILPGGKDKTVDWAGSFFIALVLVPLLLALVWGGSVYPWLSVPIVVALTISFLSVLLFLRAEKRARNPVLSLDLFRSRVFVVAISMLFLSAVGMFGAVMYIPVFSQNVVGSSATDSGLVLTPMMLSLVVTSAFSGQLIARTGQYKVLAVCGTAVIALALYLFSAMQADISKEGVILRMVLLGIGLGSTMPIYTLAVQSHYSAERMGEVTAGTQLFRNIGGAVGTAILGGIMNAQLIKGSSRLEQLPFFARLQAMDPAILRGGGEGGWIQGVLGGEKETAIHALLQSLPGPLQGVARSEFTAFIQLAREVFSKATDAVFLTAAILSTIAFVIVFFLPEVPLRRTAHPVYEEAGMKLDEELGQSDANHQPRKGNGGPT